MLKRRIKNNKTLCTGCGSDAGLLLVTLPRDRFLRPRTQAEIDSLNKMHDGYEKGIFSADLLRYAIKKQQRNRVIKYCPQCIKQLNKGKNK